MVEKARFMASSILVLAAFTGKVSMLLFVVFLFIGSLELVQLGLSEPAALAWDGLLSVVFFAQHSGMIRRRFRASLSSIVPVHYHDATFTIISSLVITTLVVSWQSSATLLYELPGLSRWLSRGVFFLAIAGIVWGVYALRSFDPFGRAAIRAHLRGKPLRPQQFTIRGPYLWVRHPLYFFVLLLVWSCPVVTADRLLFNSLWTVWIFVGTVLEEEDLLADIGDAYRDYQRRVPMLVPWRVPGDS